MCTYFVSEEILLVRDTTLPLLSSKYLNTRVYPLGTCLPRRFLRKGDFDSPYRILYVVIPPKVDERRERDARKREKERSFKKLDQNCARRGKGEEAKSQGVDYAQGFTQGRGGAVGGLVEARTWTEVRVSFGLRGSTR